MSATLTIVISVLDGVPSVTIDRKDIDLVIVVADYDIERGDPEEAVETKYGPAYIEMISAEIERSYVQEITTIAEALELEEEHDA